MGWTRRRIGALAVGVMGLAAAAVATSAYFWVERDFNSAGPLTTAQTIVIPRGAGLQPIAYQLADAGIIRSRWSFLGGVALAGREKPLQAGEYAFAAGTSVRDIVQMLQAGRILVHHLTVPEGLLTAQVLALVAGADRLTGDLPSPPPPDGSLLPETYNYVLGDNRTEIVERMRKAMDTTLAQIWASRDPGLALASPRDAVTLASIVEKETSLDAERPRVAAVFLNRIKHGMRLQADPTAAYAVNHGAAMLARTLTRSDLEQQDPFNTYTHDGLPAGPIANPGKAALEAATHPAVTDELYFVATGSGGHVFARTLDEHNRNVARWRDVLRRSEAGK